MFKPLSLFCFALCALMVVTIIGNADAQFYLRKNQQTQTQQPQPQPQTPQRQAAPSQALGAPSQTSVEYAKRAANACTGGQWETPACLKAISENVYIMASNYGAALQQRGKKADSERIKEHCAAATAAAQETFPAYAMRSAYVECANMVYDVTESSRVQPDLSQYQLLVGAVQCLDKTMACKAVEIGLKQYK